jgi:hypothetical protein
MWTPKKKLLTFRSRAALSLEFLGGQLGSGVTSFSLSSFLVDADPGQVFLVACGGNTSPAVSFLTCSITGVPATLLATTGAALVPGAIFGVAAPHLDGANVVVNASGNVVGGLAVGVWRAVWYQDIATANVAVNVTAAQSLTMVAGGAAIGIAGAESAVSFTSGLTNRTTLTDGYNYSWRFGDAMSTLPGATSVDATGASYPMLVAASFGQR